MTLKCREVALSQTLIKYTMQFRYAENPTTCTLKCSTLTLRCITLYHIPAQRVAHDVAISYPESFAPPGQPRPLIMEIYLSSIIIIVRWRDALRVIADPGAITRVPRQASITELPRPETRFKARCLTLRDTEKILSR